MFILMSFLLMDVKFEHTNLDSLTGKWTAGTRMSSFLTFSEYSILWRRRKTVLIGIEGGGSLSNQEDDYYGWSGSAGIGLYKYFRANSSLSPFVALSPRFNIYYSYSESEESWYEYLSQTYSGNLDFGLEYFFTLYDKQLSLKLKTPLVSISRVYRENKYSNKEGYSDIRDNVTFYLPTESSLSTWVCFHF